MSGIAGGRDGAGNEKPALDLVARYALTNRQHTPWQVEHRLRFHDAPCRFCQNSVCPQGHHAGLEKVGPEPVARAVRGLLSSRQR